MAPVLLDADVLIWVMRGDARARAFLLGVRHERRLLPAIVVMEVAFGCRDRSELRRLRKIVDGSFARVTHVTDEISRRATALVERYALSHRLRPADALVAATALTLNVQLATGNTRDFRHIPGLQLLPYRARG